MKAKHKPARLSPHALKFLDTIEVPTTRETNAFALKAFYAFRAACSPPLSWSNITIDVLDDFNAWLVRHKYAPTSRRTFLACVIEFLRYALDHEWLPKNFSLERATYRIRKSLRRASNQYPIPKFDPALPRVVKYFDNLPLPSDEECATDRKLRLEKLNILRGRAMMHTLYASAGRVSEVASLTRKNVQDGRRAFAEIVGKGDKERILFFTADMQSAVREYLVARADDAEPLFIRHSKGYGKSLSRSMFWKIVSGAGKKCGIQKLSPHDFRHYRASQMLRDGAPLEAIQEILGHADIGTTRKVYAHYSKTEARDIFNRYTVSASDALNKMTK